jgi:hypothetical protein
MQAKSKAQLTEKFEAKAGLLILQTDDEQRRSYRAQEIAYLSEGSGTTTIVATHGERLYYRTNHSLLFHFWQRALETGQSFDLRAICSLKKDDELYKSYTSTDLNPEELKKLAARVSIIDPTKIPLARLHAS